MKSANDGRSSVMQVVRRVCIALHRDLGYLFAGVVIIYAVSGLAMNHRQTFNPYYSAEVIEFTLPADMRIDAADITQQQVQRIIDAADAQATYSKHYVSRGHLKILLKGGSSIDVDLASRRAVCELLTERIVLGNMARLHYNPGALWTIFSDLFSIALIIITLSGFFILRGSKGFFPRGAILFLIGIIFPLITIIF